MPFDLHDYKRRTARFEWDDLDFGAFATTPLDADALRCIRYMHDVEFHTVCYLRDLLLTPAHHDPTVTAFLGFWVFEEFWHGEALAAVLAAHGEESGNARIAPLRKGLGWRDALRPVATGVGGAVAGDDFVAVHMTWGTVNELTTQAGYAQLGRRAGHPVLSELLRRIMRQEGRHIDFYESEARRRLGAGRRARGLTRFALRRLWRPVGAGVMPAAETAFLGRYLFDGDDGAAALARIDRRVDTLPGLDGLRLLQSAVG